VAKNKKARKKPCIKKDQQMKKIYLFMCISIIAAILQGCAYSHVQAPLDINYENTELGSKIGRSHNRSILWLVAWGDGGTKAAAEDGNISVIKHADLETLMILFGLYTEFTTVVYGD
jgi:hypothetical protein